LLQYLARQQRLHIFMRETRFVTSKLEDCVDNDAAAEVDASDDAAAAALGETMDASGVAAFAPVKIGSGVALNAHRPHK
jgi:hypothetical protein